jgi:hypothetical protein
MRISFVTAIGATVLIAAAGENAALNAKVPDYLQTLGSAPSWTLRQHLSAPGDDELAPADTDPSASAATPGGAPTRLGYWQLVGFALRYG